MALFPLLSKALKESFEQIKKDFTSDNNNDDDRNLAEKMNALSVEKPELSYNERIAEQQYRELLHMIKYRASTGHKILILLNGVNSQREYLRGVTGKIVKEKLRKDGFKFFDYINNDGIGEAIQWGEGEDWANRWL